MDAQQFLAEFGHIANASGGMAQLRELVLHLAVSGDLIRTESPTDALPLLAAIEAQKQAHPERKKVIAKQAAVSRAEFKVPPHWAICRLGDLALTITGGGTPSKTHSAYWGGDIPWASVKDMKEHKFLEDTEDHITEEGLKNSSSNLIQPGRVIVCTRMGLGKVAINRVAMAINQDLKALELPPEVTPDYFLILYKTLRIKGTGTTVSGIKQDQLLALPAVLPPLDEQTRIVAKVDELMALCDKLEDEQQKRRKLQNTLRQATLQAVAKAQSPHELQASWARLEANFGRLFSAPEDVDGATAELKNLAVRGLLAEGIAQDLDIEKIKSDCQALRNQYNASGLMRKQKLVAMAEPETSYPPHWATVAFDEVAIVIGGVTKGRDLRGRETLICQYLSVANVQRGYFKLDELKTIQIATDELEKYKVAKGDLLITEGGDWDKVGRTAIWPGGIDDCLHQNHVFKARVPNDLLLNEWVELVFNSGIGRDYFAGASKQTTNLASINMTQLRSFPLPIPPTTEQRAILIRLSELTQLCIEWRKLLARRQKMSSLLAQATVASLAGINLVTKEEAVKVPQTELISRLRLGHAPSIKDQAPLASILARYKGELATQDLWQRSTLEIDAFYAQLKIEVAHGWIEEPAVAEVHEKTSEEA